VPPEEFDQDTLNKQVDQLVLTITAEQSRELVAGITAYYKAGSDDVRPTTRLTNVQKNAIKRLSAEHFGYISEFNKAVGEQIKDKAKDLLTQEKGYAEISKEIRQYASDLFEGSEKVTINNVGKTRTVYKVDKSGKIIKTEKLIERPYVTNTKAYSDMLARTSTHTAWEQGRASEYQRMGFKKWRFVGPLAEERARPWHAAIVGNVYEYGTEQSDYALALLEEPNCRHRQIVYFPDESLNTPTSFFEEQKRKAGLRFDDDIGEWVMDNV
jgi:hypothetical protein